MKQKESKEVIAKKEEIKRLNDIEKFFKLFDQQVGRLKGRGCHEPIIAMFQRQRDEVVLKASKMSFSDDAIPFIPVVPRIYMGIYDQMQMTRDKALEKVLEKNERIKHETSVDIPHIDPANLVDLVTAPAKPYFIFDVLKVDGVAEKVDTQKLNRIRLIEDIDLSKILKHSSHVCLTEMEIVALAIHTEIGIDEERPHYSRDEEYVIGAGSLYRRIGESWRCDYFPMLRRSKGKCHLGQHGVEHTKSSKEIASCAERFCAI